VTLFEPHQNGTTPLQPYRVLFSLIFSVTPPPHTHCRRLLPFSRFSRKKSRRHPILSRYQMLISLSFLDVFLTFLLPKLPKVIMLSFPFPLGDSALAGKRSQPSTPQFLVRPTLPFPFQLLLFLFFFAIASHVAFCAVSLVHVHVPKVQNEKLWPCESRPLSASLLFPLLFFSFLPARAELLAQIARFLNLAYSFQFPFLHPAMRMVGSRLRRFLGRSFLFLHNFFFFSPLYGRGTVCSRVFHAGFSHCVFFRPLVTWKITFPPCAQIL